MEVEVLGVSGVPQDAIISIRAGASRRQAPVSSLGAGGTPFKFAGGPAGVNPFKLDVLQPIGSTRLALKPNGGTFSVPIKGAEGVTVNLAVREGGGMNSDMGEDLFDRIDANKDGVITRREFNEALRAEGDKPVLQPLDGGKSLPIVSANGKNQLPSLPKAEDPRFPAAANAAKEYLESHKLLPFVRALLQTVVRDRPDDPYNFIADQFRDAGGKAEDKMSELAAQLQASQEDVRKLKGELEAARGVIGKLTEDMSAMTKKAAAELKGKAQTALVSALIKDEEEDSESAVEAAKVRAREALGNAFMGDVQDLEEAKERARNALNTALFSHEDEDAVDEAKAKARDALSNALFVASNDDEEEDEVEAAKDRAREALGNVLVGPVVEEAKELARNALFAALSPPDEGEDVEATNQDAEAARESAREELAAALLSQSSRPNAQEGDELSRAESKKAQLTATKEEMGKMNIALKSEISELNESLKSLNDQRDSLRSKMDTM